MLFDHLLHLLGRLGAIVFIVFLASVFVLGILVLKGGLERTGLLLMSGVTLFLLSALKNKR